MGLICVLICGEISCMQDENLLHKTAGIPATDTLQIFLSCAQAQRVLKLTRFNDGVQQKSSQNTVLK